MSKIYELALYNKGGNTVELGMLVSRSFIENDLGGEVNWIPIIKDFLRGIDTTGIEEPVNLLLNDYVDKIEGYTDLGDFCSTLSYLGYRLIIVQRIGDDTKAFEDIVNNTSTTNGYLLLPNCPSNLEGMSYPLFYKGWVVPIEDTNQSVASVGMDILTIVSVPTLFSKFTNIQSVREYYSSIIAQGYEGTYTDTSSFELMKSLGYTPLIIVGV